MEDMLRCTICDGVDLDDSLGTFLCNRCKYSYAVFSKDKMKSIYENTRMIRFDSLDDSMTRSYVNDILEYDPNNPFALFAKGCIALRRGFSYRAMKLFENSYGIFKYFTSLSITGCTLKNLEISMVFEIQNHMLEKIDSISRKYAKNPNVDNRDLMMDVLDEVGNLFSYYIENIGMKIPDILLVKIYDRLSSVALSNILDGLKLHIGKMKSDIGKGCSSSNNIDGILEMINILSLLERYSILEDSLSLMDMIQTLILNGLKDIDKDGENISNNLDTKYKNVIRNKLFEINESNIRINKRMITVDFKNDIEELIETIYVTVLNYYKFDVNKVMARMKKFGLKIEDDFVESHPNDSYKKFDMGRWTYLESKKIDSSIMNLIRLPTWLF